MLLSRRSHWIFDLDGTLTVAVHDFDAIRARLGLPEGQPILESLAALPNEEATPLHRRLEDIEEELARAARPQPGAPELLEHLHAQGVQVGILTRNTRRLALISLEGAGLSRWFDPDWVLGRTDATPKPDPAGIKRLLAAWGAESHQTVMVGDYLFDLQAGRAAGCATIHLGPERPSWVPWTDLRVSSLTDLLVRLA